MTYRLPTPKECGEQDYISATARKYFKTAFEFAKAHDFQAVKINKTVFQFIIPEERVVIYLANQWTTNPRRWSHRLIRVSE